MTEAMKPGAIARVTGVPEDWHYDLHVGDTFQVWEYVSGLQVGDTGYGDENYIQDAYYTGWAEDGAGTVDAPAHLVEQVLSAEQATARKIPTVEQVTEFIGYELCTDGEDFEISETDYSPPEDGGIVCYGKTNDGLRFGFMVQVVNVYRVDD